MQPHPSRVSRPRFRSSAGFTLIELVVVLTIMAVLAAIALPRFMNLQRDARIGHLEGVRGSFASGSALLHAAMLTRRGVADPAACPADVGIVADNHLAGPGTACTEGGVVHTIHGYPAATPLGTPGIVSAAGLGTSFNPNAGELAGDGYRVIVAAGRATVQRVDASDPDTCSFTYSEPPAPATAAVLSPSTTSGC